MGDFLSHLVTGRVKAAVIGVALVGLCLTLAGATSAPVVSTPAFLIAGMSEIPAPPAGSSWAPAPVDVNGLRMVASTDGQRFELHTVAGARTFLPGVNLGATTPGNRAISAAQYRAWFAAMGWLGLRVVRIATIHPPTFYQQLAAHNETNPVRPLYLMQGVNALDDEDASDAVSGKLSRPGRVSGNWDTDASPWLIGWIIGAQLDPTFDRSHPNTPAVHGKYFRSTGDATPTERRLAARMDQLAAAQAKKGLSQPIAFGDHPKAEANHVRPTADWPAGTFAAYRNAEHLRHPDMPTLITEFGVSSSIDEQGAMATDAEQLRRIKDQGLSAGFLVGWTDEWAGSWHDPLATGQHLGLLAMDATGQPGAPAQVLVDKAGGWPARRVTARVDESYLNLRMTLTGSRPSVLTLGFDVKSDAAFTLDLAGSRGKWWHLEGDDLVLRVPWAMMGFTDPSAHRIDKKVSPGVTITLSASGRRQTVGQVTWPNWNLPYYTERLKQGAELVRNAALSVTND